MVLSVEWAEYNAGAPNYSTPTVANITNSNWGSDDSANLDPAAFPITAGLFSFNKQHAVRFSNFAVPTPETAQNFFLWGSVGIGPGAGVIGGGLDTLVYADSGGQTPSSPAESALPGGLPMPEVIPGASNIGGSASSDGDGSNIFRHQVQTNSNSPSGNSVTLSFQYDVVA